MMEFSGNLFARPSPPSPLPSRSVNRIMENFRPLSYCSSDPNDKHGLTLNHSFTAK